MSRPRAPRQGQGLRRREEKEENNRRKPVNYRNARTADPTALQSPRGFVRDWRYGLRSRLITAKEDNPPPSARLIHPSLVLHAVGCVHAVASLDQFRRTAFPKGLATIGRVDRLSHFCKPADAVCPHILDRAFSGTFWGVSQKRTQQTLALRGSVSQVLELVERAHTVGTSQVRTKPYQPLDRPNQVDILVFPKWRRLIRG